jgi:hypothetical protein
MNIKCLDPSRRQPRWMERGGSMIKDRQGHSRIVVPPRDRRVSAGAELAEMSRLR